MLRPAIVTAILLSVCVACSSNDWNEALDATALCKHVVDDCHIQLVGGETPDEGIAGCVNALKPLRGSQACVDAFNQASCSDLASYAEGFLPSACTATCQPSSSGTETSTCSSAVTVTRCKANYASGPPGTHGGGVTGWFAATYDCGDECAVGGFSSSEGCTDGDCKCKP